jgi:hypothetical protein
MRTVFDLAPFLEMSSYDLFRLGTGASFFDTPDIKRAVLSCESTDTTHVITIVGKLVACEAVLARIGQRAFGVRECMQVFALPTIGTAPPGKEKTTIAHAGGICSRQAGIFLDAAARLGFCFAARDKLAHDASQTKARGIRALSNCPPCHRRPTCYTICLPSSEHTLECRKTGFGHALYSFPVCGAVSLSTAPGSTCFRAGLSFFCFGTTAFAAEASTCVSVLLVLIVWFEGVTSSADFEI